MDDQRTWVPVEVIWDENPQEYNPWGDNPGGRAAQHAGPRRPRPEYDWPQEWQAEEEDAAQEGWGDPKHVRQESAGLSKRKRKKLRARDREEGR